MTDEPVTMPPGWTFEGFESDLTWPGSKVLEDPETSVVPQGCTDSVWILHNQYVCPPGIDPGSFDDEELNYLPAPPPEFVRVRWREVASIKVLPLRGPYWDGTEVPPCFRWPAFLGWDKAPLIVPGAEFVYQPVDATIGQVEFEMLMPLLRSATGSNRLRAMYADTDPYQGVLNQPVTGGLWQGRYVYSLELSTMLSSLLAPGRPGTTPEFWWPEDRSWLIWTGRDLLGSKIFGDRELIDGLRRHPGLETLDWLPHHRPSPSTAEITLE